MWTRWHRKALAGAAIGWCVSTTVCWGGEGGGQTGAAQQAGQAMAVAVGEGAVVELEYTLTVDGKVVDTNAGKEPLSYVQGRGQLISGLERELNGLTAGQSKDVTLSPKDGYGEVDPEAFITVSREQLPKGVAPKIGMVLRGSRPDGKPFQARIHEVHEKNVTLDLNHPLAGKTLHFQVKVLRIGPHQ